MVYHQTLSSWGAYKTSFSKSIDMKTKRDKDYYLKRAINGFKILIIYQCVTKPQFDPVYKGDNGKFSKEKMFEEAEFLDKWNKMPKKRQNYHTKHHTEYFKQYKKHSAHHNLAFGLDCRLVEKILGTYRDDEGNKVRISIDEVLQNLNGWFRCSNCGKIIRRKKGIKPFPVCWWKKKYFIADKNYWVKLLDNPQYSKLETYPRETDGEAWAIEQIWKYRKETIHKKYSSMLELCVDFNNDMIDELLFRKIAVKQFNQSEEKIGKAILSKKGQNNDNNENQTRTHYQDKQGQKVSDETSSPIEGADNSAPSGQGEERIFLEGLVQETQGLQEEVD